MVPVPGKTGSSANHRVPPVRLAPFPPSDSETRPEGFLPESGFLSEKAGENGRVGVDPCVDRTLLLPPLVAHLLSIYAL